VTVNAVISGQAGVALLVNGAELASIHAGRSGEIVRRSLAEARFLLGDAGDLQFLEDIEIDEVIRRLELASSQMDAFHTALILLDGSLPSETRQIAAEELQELMEDEAVVIFVESVLFAHPLTKDSDLTGALAVCTARTRGFLHRLASLQGEITEVHQAWESIATPVFGKEEDRKTARAVAVREGLFRDLVLCRVALAPVNQFLTDVLIKSKLHHGREILLAWVAPFRDTEAVPQASIGEAMNRHLFARVKKHSAITAPPASSSPTSLAAEPQRRSERVTIGPSIVIRGDLTGDEDLVIEGRVEGKVDLKQNNVTVGKSGKVKADVYGEVVIVEGEVDGNIFAQEMVIVRQSGAILGNISAPRVVLEDGSRFKGSIDMTAKDSGRSQASPGMQGQAQRSKEHEAAAVKAAG
jgi:cytoskeletal protein CcmA (bactofilin family)